MHGDQVYGGGDARQPGRGQRDASEHLALLVSATQKGKAL